MSRKPKKYFESEFGERLRRRAQTDQLSQIDLQPMCDYRIEDTVEYREPLACGPRRDVQSPDERWAQ
jgi:hypothetical protein